jgi:hypothetical protein
LRAQRAQQVHLTRNIGIGRIKINFSSRQARWLSSFMEFLPDRGHAALQDCELGRGNRTGNDRPQRAEPD